MKGMYMYNFRTEQTDCLTDLPDDLRDYIPQHAPSQNLYTMLIEEGMTPALASIQVLFAQLGEGGNADDQPKR